MAHRTFVGGFWRRIANVGPSGSHAEADATATPFAHGSTLADAHVAIADATADPSDRDPDAVGHPAVLERISLDPSGGFGVVRPASRSGRLSSLAGREQSDDSPERRSVSTRGESNPVARLYIGPKGCS